MRNIREDLKDLKIPSDSLEMLDLVVELEDMYDIIISNSDASEWKTEEDIIKYIEEALASE